MDNRASKPRRALPPLPVLTYNRPRSMATVAGTASSARPAAAPKLTASELKARLPKPVKLKRTSRKTLSFFDECVEETKGPEDALPVEPHSEPVDSRVDHAEDFRVAIEHHSELPELLSDYFEPQNEQGASIEVRQAPDLSPKPRMIALRASLRDSSHLSDPSQNSDQTPAWLKWREKMEGRYGDLGVGWKEWGVEMKDVKGDWKVECEDEKGKMGCGGLHDYS